MKGIYFIFSHSRKFLFFLCTALYAVNISAQMHIGSDAPPHSSAMLEVTSANKGVLFPTVALKAINDSTVIENSKPVNGLLVYNTTANDSLSLYKGLYAWNSATHLWDNISTGRSFHGSTISFFAAEETHLVANRQNKQFASAESQQILAKSSAQIIFPASCISVNKDNCFNTSNYTFTAKKSGYYKVICGVEAYTEKDAKEDKIELQMIITKPKGGTETAVSTAERQYLLTWQPGGNNPYMPLSPSVFYNDYFEKGTSIDVYLQVNLVSASKVYVNRAYLYVSEF
jgi:hypothetical protein